MPPPKKTYKPKSNVRNKIRSVLQKKAVRTPLRLVSGLGTAWGLYDLATFGGSIFSDALANYTFGEEGKKPVTAQDTRNSYSELIAEARKNAKKRSNRGRISPLRGMATKEGQELTRKRAKLLELQLAKKRNKRKGGKVGKPKGVGCAIKGYGKAMKRGK